MRIDLFVAFFFFSFFFFTDVDLDDAEVLHVFTCFGDNNDSDGEIEISRKSVKIRFRFCAD